MISDNDKNIIEKVTNISRDLSFKKEIKLQYRNICTELSQKYPEKADIIKQYSIKEKDLIIVLSILNKIKPQKGLEIGSFCGVSANGFLTMFSNLKLDCVDPWETFEIENTELIFNNLVDCYSDRIQKERAFFGSRNNHFNSQIDLNLQIFYPKNKYDFVFLDGDHRTSSLILAFMILGLEHSMT